MRLPPDPIRRRRLAALALAGVLSAVAGAAVGSEGGEPDGRPAAAGASGSVTAGRPATAPAGARPGERAGTTGTGPSGALPTPPTGAGRRGPGALATPAQERGRVSTRALEREAGATIVMRFAGTRAPAHVLRALRERRAAGVILFGDNVRSPGQLRALTRAVQRAAGGRALVMIDQEGGGVRRIPWAAPATAPPAVRTTARAEAVARATARDLRAAGVNVNLAPVADVGAWPGSVMRDRAFPGRGDRVARLVAATVRAYRGSGVLATAKHFPGLGRATVNTDVGPATVAGRGDLRPFRAAVDVGVPLIMAGHALYPSIDRGRIASQSSRVLVGLLRRELGFDGACVTDALEARAVVERSSVGTAAVRSMRAGCDLLLTTVPGSYRAVLRRLVADARRDPALRRRLAEARARIDALLGSPER